MSTTFSPVKVKINRFDDVENAVESIIGKMMDAATRVIVMASIDHVEQAKRNVKEAYTTAGYYPISLIYAHWLLENVEGFDESEEDMDAETAARALQKAHTSLMLSGEMLEGIGFSSPVVKGASVIGHVFSRAPYSRDIETAFLFDKQRDSLRARPFFTSHLWETHMSLKRDILSEIREEFRNE